MTTDFKDLRKAPKQLYEPRDYNTISWTELSTFARCKRQWYLKYFRGYKLRKDINVESRTVGTLFHQAVAHYYAPDKFDEPFQPMFELLATDELDIDTHDHYDKTLKQSTMMFENYREWLKYEEEDRFIEVISVEEKLNVPIKTVLPDLNDQYSDMKLLGYVDLVGQDSRTGLPFLMEHKTTLSSYNHWLASTLLQLKWQVKLYTLMYLQEDNRELDVVFNVARRVKTKKSQPPLFWRYKILFGPKELEHARKVFTQRVTELLEYDELIRTYPDYESWANPAFHCSFCDFKPVCSTFDEGQGEPIKLMKSLYSDREERKE